MNNNNNKNLNQSKPVVVENQGGSGAYVVTAVLAFVIGFGCAWLIYSKHTPAVGTNATSTATSSMNAAADNSSSNGSSKSDTSSTMSSSNTSSSGSGAGESISVADQPAGAAVDVANVTLKNPSWVVIRETDETGAVGRILGAQLFDVGTNPGTVELLRGTLSGKTYFAMIYDDNGDHAFDPKTDLPATDASGNSIQTTFKAQ